MEQFYKLINELSDRDRLIYLTLRNYEEVAKKDGNPLFTEIYCNTIRAIITMFDKAEMVKVKDLNIIKEKSRFLTHEEVKVKMDEQDTKERESIKKIDDALDKSLGPWTDHNDI